MSSLLNASNLIRTLRKERDEARSRLMELVSSNDSVSQPCFQCEQSKQQIDVIRFQLDEARVAADVAQEAIVAKEQEIIAMRGRLYANQRADVQQLAQLDAHRDAELREARIAVLDAQKALKQERRRATAAEEARDSAVARLRALDVTGATTGGGVVAAVAQVQHALQQQTWYRGFTAQHAEWRLGDVPLDANALILQQHAVRQLRNALPAHNFLLQRIDLSRTGLVLGDCVHVVALVEACPPLEALQLDGNALGDEGVSVLAQKFADAPASVPRHLSFRACGLGWRACASLGALAHGAPRLCSLNVSHNVLGRRGGEQLARAIAMDSYRSHIHSIAARGCALEQGAAALAEAAVWLQRLSLDLESPRYEHVDDAPRDEWDEKNGGVLSPVDPADAAQVDMRLSLVQALARTLYTQAQRRVVVKEVVAEDPSMLGYLSSWWRAPVTEHYEAVQADNGPIEQLRSLSLSVTGLGRIGLGALSDALRHNRSLTMLRLTRCQLNDQGAQMLFGALQEQGGVQELDVSRNEIGDFGAQFVADMLSTGSVTVLNLSHNIIGTSGAAAIGAGVAKSASLQVLALAGNPVGDVASLATAVETAPALQRLDLRHIESKAVSWLSLERAAEKRKQKDVDPLTIVY